MTEEKEKLEETTPEVKEKETILTGTSSDLASAGDVPTVVTPSDLRAPPPEREASSQESETADEDRDSSEVEKLKEELESVRGQVTRLEHERYLLSRGVPEEDLDYYAFKIEHMEGAKSDFRKAAKEYLKAHPVRRTAVSSGADLTAGSTRRPATSSELMNQLLRNR